MYWALLLVVVLDQEVEADKGSEYKETGNERSNSAISGQGVEDRVEQIIETADQVVKAIQAELASPPQ